MSDQKVIPIKGGFQSLDALLATMAERYPAARTGIVIVFEPDGTVHTHFHCNIQELSTAGGRLLYLANKDGD